MPANGSASLSAKWKLSGLRETHFDGTRAGRNFMLDRQVEPLVMESEISGLADLHAYMKYQNYVTRFSFPYFNMSEVAKGFELRERPDDRLPFDPKMGRNGETELPSSELKQVPELAVAPQVQEAPKTPEMQQDLGAEVREPQNLILRG